MRLKGAHEFPVDGERLWEALQDPQSAPAGASAPVPAPPAADDRVHLAVAGMFVGFGLARGRGRRPVDRSPMRAAAEPRAPHASRGGP